MQGLVIVLDVTESRRLEEEHVEHFVLVSTPRAADAYVRSGDVLPERIVMVNGMGSDVKFAYAMGMLNPGESATLLAFGHEITVTKELPRGPSQD
jgi:hypothetical protein